MNQLLRFFLIIALALILSMLFSCTKSIEQPRYAWNGYTTYYTNDKLDSMILMNHWHYKWPESGEELLCALPPYPIKKEYYQIRKVIDTCR